MPRFRYLPHTADMRFVAYGKGFNKALENSSLALLNIMLDLKAIKKDRSQVGKVTIKESADTYENLVWYVLQTILSKVDSRKLNAMSFKVKSLKSNGKMTLKGELGYKKTRKDYALLSVKAVTPHDLSVKKKGAIFSINVVVDV